MLTKFDYWGNVPEEPQPRYPPNDLIFSNAIWRYVRATASTRKGGIAVARVEYEKLVLLRLLQASRV